MLSWIKGIQLIKKEFFPLGMLLFPDAPITVPDHSSWSEDIWGGENWGIQVVFLTDLDVFLR